MNECTCNDSWEIYSQCSKEYSLALRQAEYASLKWIRTTKKKFKAAWGNHDKYTKALQQAMDTYLEARKNCPEHGRKEAIG